MYGLLIQAKAIKLLEENRGKTFPALKYAVASWIEHGKHET